MSKEIKIFRNRSLEEIKKDIKNINKPEDIKPLLLEGLKAKEVFDEANKSIKAQIKEVNATLKSAKQELEDFKNTVRESVLDKATFSQNISYKKDGTQSIENTDDIPRELFSYVPEKITTKINEKFILENKDKYEYLIDYAPIVSKAKVQQAQINGKEVPMITETVDATLSIQFSKIKKKEGKNE